MKKFFYNVYFLCLLIICSISNVYAAIDLSENTAIIFYLVCGGFILAGVVLIIYGRFSNGSSRSGYSEDNKKSDIAGLKDNDKQKSKSKNNNKTNTLEIDSSFNFDAIFKILPSFSPNKILNDNFNKLKDEIMKDNHVKKVKLVDKRITYFEEIDNGYLMKAQYITEENYLEDDDKYDKKRKCKYEIILNSIKKGAAIQVCPVCGGKIKDPTLLRCKFCGSILPVTTNTNNNNDEWTFEKYEKIDQI